MSDWGSQARASIDEIDAQIVELIRERQEAVQGLHIWKDMNELPLIDREREREVVEYFQTYFGDEYGTIIAQGIMYAPLTPEEDE